MDISHASSFAVDGHSELLENELKLWLASNANAKKDVALSA
jgi:hypothetical protein